MALTKIEWADCSFNPWWGCSEVSPGCASVCYAKTFAIRLGMRDLWPEKGLAGVDRAHEFRFFGDKHWDEPLKWARTLPAKLGRRPRVFCASMADVFEERDELEEPRERLFNLIRATKELDWLLLTKRPEFARDWWAMYRPDWTGGANVWLGVSIENARYTWRADVLREIPAAVRFISAEPLLGSLYEETPAWARQAEALDRINGLPPVQLRAPLDLSGIDWVIIGGESGPKARPFHLEHAREIIAAARDGCTLCAEVMPRVLVGGGESHGYPPIWWHDDGHASYRCDAHGQAGPAVFVKQLGAKPVIWPAGFGAAPPPEPLKLRDRKGGDMDEWPADLRIREFPRSAA